MKRSMTHVLALAAAGYQTADAAAQRPMRYEPVDQVVADRNPLSTSLRRLQAGLRHPIGFQEVYQVPGEPGKLMRVHGGVQAVFSQSLYEFNEDDQIEPVIPPNTVFRIGPRLLPGSGVLSQIDGHPGVAPLMDAEAMMHPHRVVAEGFGRGAVLPQPRRRPAAVKSEAPAQQPAAEGVNEVDVAMLPSSIDAPGTIIGDEHYRRQRVRELLRRAADAE